MNSGRFAGKSVLVTGGASGMGRSIVERFLDESAAVVLFDISAAMTEQAQRELGGRGELATLVGDTAVREDVRKAVAVGVERFGGLDILIAQAGIAALTPFLEIEDAEWDRMLSVNLTGTFYAVQEAAKVMAATGRGGSIVVTSSQNAFFPHYNTSHYSATKGALVTLVRAAALDLAEHGIRLNAISPGFIRTPLAAPLVNDRKTAAGLLEHVPMRRFGEPDEVASVALFLASEEASYITGSNIVVDGGTTLGMSLGVSEVVLPGFTEG